MNVHKAVTLHIATILFFVAGILAVFACSGCKHLETTESPAPEEQKEDRELYDTVLIVYNGNSNESRNAAGNFLEKHNIPVTNICSLDIPGTERISAADFEEKVRKRIQDSLERAGKTRIEHIILCTDIPRSVVKQKAGDFINFDDMIASVWNKFPGGYVNPSHGTPDRAAEEELDIDSMFPEYSVMRLSLPDVSDSPESSL